MLFTIIITIIIILLKNPVMTSQSVTLHHCFKSSYLGSLPVLSTHSLDVTTALLESAKEEEWYFLNEKAP